MGLYDDEIRNEKKRKMENKKAFVRLIVRIGVPVFFLLIMLIMLPMVVSINDAGQRTVIQWPNGKLFVKFTPGMYIQAFGSTTEYKDFITFDFDRSQAQGGATTLDQAGISIRYQDGGMGTVYGKARFGLPSDAITMLKLHKAFRSNAGLANKLIKPVTEEAMNLTAGLMRSEEAYATKRAIFTQLAKSQINKGKFQTKLESTSIKDEATGKTVWKEVPVVALNKNKQQVHLSSDLVEFGIVLAGFQLNDPGFEPSTMKQISDKRDATMAIITAKANAERAKQEAITAEEKGKANVMTAKYEQEVEKEKAIVMAQREKEVATIKAQQKVEVAKQAKVEAVEMKLRAKEVKEEQILLGEGEAERKRLVMEADGALTQKLDAFIAVNKTYAAALSEHRLVPDIQFGTNAEGSNGATDLINMLMVKTAKDLSVSTTVSQ